MFKKFVACMTVSLIGILVLAGCGRKGALEPPPSSRIEAENDTVQEKPQQDRPFILDGLIQ